MGKKTCTLHVKTKALKSSYYHLMTMCSTSFTNDNQVTLACNIEKDRHVHLNLRTAGNSYVHVLCIQNCIPKYKKRISRFARSEEEMDF